MGEVYRARDLRLGRIVAIKVLPPEAATSPQARSRFEREAQTIAQLSHPNICVLHDVGTAEQCQYLVMELLHGETLGQRLTRGPLAFEELRRLGLDVADALQSAHQHGIIHRDIKPSNIMITERGDVKVLDFGIARVEDPPITENEATDIDHGRRPLTGAGVFIGTVGYVSPEQALGGPVTAATDIFSLAVLLYEAATGQRPFAGNRHVDWMQSMMTQNPLAPSTHAPDLPEAFDALIRRMLEKRPEQRPSTAEVVAVLREMGTISAPARVRQPALPLRPVVGRERELNELATIVRSDFGRVIAIAGEAGRRHESHY